MAWGFVFIAGVLEVGWALGLKLSEGFSRPYVSVVTVVTMILSFVMLAQGLKTIPVGTAYAVWTGIGVLGTTVFGMIFFSESRDVLRIGCLALILLGILGLRFLSPEGHG